MTHGSDPTMFRFAPEVARWLQTLWAVPTLHQALLTMLPTVLTHAYTLAQHQGRKVIDQQHLDQALAQLATITSHVPVTRPPKRLKRRTARNAGRRQTRYHTQYEEGAGVTPGQRGRKSLSGRTARLRREEES